MAPYVRNYPWVTILYEYHGDKRKNRLNLNFVRERREYCMSKKSWPILYSNLLHRSRQLSDQIYNRENTVCPISFVSFFIGLGVIVYYENWLLEHSVICANQNHCAHRNKSFLFLYCRHLCTDLIIVEIERGTLFQQNTTSWLVRIYCFDWIWPPDWSRFFFWLNPASWLV